MSAHTPGPWMVSSEGQVRGCGSYVCSAGYDVNGDGSARPSANACLIAAAPELLHALRTVIDCADDAESADEALDLAGAAIAKAEGTP